MEYTRTHFRALIAQNPNYFGNLEGSIYPPIDPMLGNTSYEEVTCVGFNPDLNVLEAVVQIKRSTGYRGDLCSDGSTEFVRFFLDYGAGWVDAGMAGVQVHDIPGSDDCAGTSTQPLCYIVSLEITPNDDICSSPVLPTVRAILSWDVAPPAGAVNVGWSPAWGNVLDVTIQIKPRWWTIFDVVGVLSESASVQLTVPTELQAVQYQPIPIPDPPPLALAELVQLYSPSEAAAGVNADAEVVSSVPAHRFGFGQLHTALSSVALDQTALADKAAYWTAAGLDWSETIGVLADTEGDVTYEELDCVGLDIALSRLVATFHIKQPSGYLGDLCQAGSVEYVSFWSDWDDTCTWTLEGTVPVSVHDVATIPADGLHYAAILPVDLTSHRRPCGEPKIGRVRAVLSWNTPPSPDPEAPPPVWGNRRDVHVQIPTGDTIDGIVAVIRALGGIHIAKIDTGATGMTLPDAVFWYNPAYFADDAMRPCPFGGQVLVDSDVWFEGYKYQVMARTGIDPPIVLSDNFDLVRAADGVLVTQTAVGGYFTYLNPTQYLTRTIAQWQTSGDALWEVQLTVYDPITLAPLAWTSWLKIQLDNTAPEADIKIAFGGDCKDVDQGQVVIGDFVARDANFGHWTLTTEPDTVMIPSNQPVANNTGDALPLPLDTHSQTAPRVPAVGYPWSGGHQWAVKTDDPIHMRPCGYVIRLEVWDRSIVGSVPFSHNPNVTETALCLRQLPI